MMGFANPIFAHDFPDPMIVETPDRGFLAVGTNGNGRNVQTLHATDLGTWTEGPDALPTLPPWSTPGAVWAPEVTVDSSGQYRLYYTTRAPDWALQCISVAVADSPGGPYRDASTGPLIWQKEEGGSIDAHPFTTTAGQRFLYWKNDGNAIGGDTYIYVQGVDPSGTRLTGAPRRILTADEEWEGSLIEAPFVWQRGPWFHLFYSGNAYESDHYAVGHAVGRSPLGPFTKSADPVLASNTVASGPGHCSLFSWRGRTWMVYHAWLPGLVGTTDPGRTVWLSEVFFGPDGTVEVTQPAGA